jgi:lipoyl synthase
MSMLNGHTLETSAGAADARTASTNAALAAAIHGEFRAVLRRRRLTERALRTIHYDMSEPRFSPKPPWLKVRAPGGETYNSLKSTFRALDLHTVCEEARCPNVGECWGEGTATVMLLGDVCTRGCRFCAVTTGDPRGAVDVREPEHVARALSQLELQYVVLTMVDRDDLLDGGASHVARTVAGLRERRPDMLVEVLLGDFAGHLDYVDVTVDAKPHVWAHNIEVVRRLQRTIRDVRCSYERSLGVLERVKKRDPSMITKSSIMVGVGETDEEVRETLKDLRASGVDLVTLGQYLRPTPKHAEVMRYVTPETFDTYAAYAKELGFAYCASGPLVRSSYKAAEVFVRSVIAKDRPEDVETLLRERLVSAQRAAQAYGVEAAEAAGSAVAGSVDGGAAGSAAQAAVGDRLPSLSEMSARSASTLVSAASLVRRGQP